jgi:hypothetical protein
MHNPLPKITFAGRAGICLLAFAAERLAPHLPPPALLYGLSVLGVMLISWEAVTYATQLVQHIRSKSYQGPWYSLRCRGEPGHRSYGGSRRFPRHR